MFLIKFIFRPTDAQRIVTNNIFFACVLATASLTGSFVSVLVVSALVWPFLWFGRYSEFQKVPKEAKLVALAFALFFLVEAIGCIAFGGDQALNEAVENLPFLGIVPMWWVIQAHPRQMLTTVIKVAVIVSLLSAALALMQLFAFGLPRVELSAGNPNVLAIVAAVLYLILAIGIAEDIPVWPWQWLAAGLFGAIILILLTGSRAMWPAIIVVPLLVFLTMRPKSLRLHPRIVAIGLAMAALIALVLYKPVTARIHYSQTELTAILDGDLTTSVGARIQLWKIGLQVFQAHPWFGVGSGNYQTVMNETLEAETGTKIGFSHAHNMFINVLVRDGILGLVALMGMFVVPFAVAVRALHQNGGSQKTFLALLCGIQVVYLFAGSVGLAIGHDITDAVFVAGSVFALFGLLFPYAY